MGAKSKYGRRLAGWGAVGPFDKLRAEHKRRWVRRRLGEVEIGLRALKGSAVRGYPRRPVSGRIPARGRSFG